MINYRDNRFFINVLDKGYVRLVDYMGTDLSVVRAARVSYDADWRTGKDEGSDEKLIKYLIRNRHTSPFESVVFTFEVKAPIFVFRQWHRHRTWSYNELSARYAQLPDDVYIPDPILVGVQSTHNKQVREVKDIGPQESAQRHEEVEAFKQSVKDSFGLYNLLLEQGWPRELARAVLPLSIYSRMFATVDLHNFLHFVSLRNHAHAQYEIRVYAAAMLKLVEYVVPITIAAWREANNDK